MKITRMVKNRKVIRLRTSMFPLYKLRSPHYRGEAQHSTESASPWFHRHS